MARKKHKRSAFVPRLLVPAAAVVSVVPACVLASCSGGETSAVSGGSVGSSSTSSSSTSTSSSSGFLGVAAVAYPAYEAGTGSSDAGDPGDAADGSDDASHPFPPPLAYTAFEGGKG